jgi:hypothetical protein
LNRPPVGFYRAAEGLPAEFGFPSQKARNIFATIGGQFGKPGYPKQAIANKSYDYANVAEVGGGAFGQRARSVPEKPVGGTGLFHERGLWSMIAPIPSTCINEDDNPIRSSLKSVSNVFLFVTMRGLRRSTRWRLLSPPIGTWRPTLWRLTFAIHEP